MTKTIDISLTEELLLQVDQYAKALYATRSAYIRHAIIEQLRNDARHEGIRKTMAKQLPQKYIVNHPHEEFGISEEYV